MTLSADELRWMKGLAEAATPGPWHQLKNHESVWPADGDFVIARTDAVAPRSRDQQITDAAFIAALNPATALSLIQAAELNAELVGALEPFAESADGYGDSWTDEMIVRFWSRTITVGDLRKARAALQSLKETK